LAVRPVRRYCASMFTKCTVTFSGVHADPAADLITDLDHALGVL
jgi:hypothetical protein